jgi:hypothetical protein
MVLPFLTDGESKREGTGGIFAELSGIKDRQDFNMMGYGSLWA